MLAEYAFQALRRAPANFPGPWANNSRGEVCRRSAARRGAPFAIAKSGASGIGAPVATRGKIIRRLVFEMRIKITGLIWSDRRKTAANAARRAASPTEAKLVSALLAQALEYAASLQAGCAALT